MKRWPSPEPESALVVLVPEAEELVADFRAEFDPSEAAGIPAHITVLYPFVSPASDYSAVKDRIRTTIGSHQRFDYMISGIKRFTGVVYLEPNPSEIFQALTMSVWEAFPDFPPYGGKHTNPTPHLTVGAKSDERVLDRLAGDLAKDAMGVLPIRASCSEITLFDNSDGPWRVVTTFPLKV
jgi:hypothetical protein